MEYLLSKYYFPVVKKLIYLLKDLQSAPFEKKVVCRELQENLISQISNIEYKIRKIKAQLSETTKRLGDKNLRNSRAEALKLKKLKVTLNEKLDQYQEYRHFLKSIGDAIAFLYINKYDLKPQNFKQSTGFITNKKGSRFERKCWRHIFQKGGIAILNDLTNVLKYFDLTIVKDFDVWFPLELKSSSASKKKVQSEKGAILLKYLFEDIPTDIYNSGHQQHRVEPTVEMINHIELVNSLIARARSEGYLFHLIEDGLLIVISFEEPSNFPDEILEKYNIEKPMMFLHNQYKFSQLGYYPHSLSFSAADYLDFLTDNLTIIQIYDFGVVEKLAAKHGYSCDAPGIDEAFIRFVSVENSEYQFAISSHYFGRIFQEFMSPHSLIMDSIDMFNKMKKKELELTNSNSSFVGTPPEDLKAFKKYIKNIANVPEPKKS